jgi:glycosyltransferase involved in cell wall biosynthesis
MLQLGTGQGAVVQLGTGQGPMLRAGLRVGSQRPPISAAIICYNEERNMERCLDGVRWCEQIVVVDSGSTDRTLDVVRGYPHPRVAVCHRAFDTYVAQKNFALDRCDHDWVLSVDADEVLPARLVEEIAGLAFDVDGYHVGRRTFLGSREIRHGTWSPDYQLRLFRRTRGRWGGSNPHEAVILDGPSRRLAARMLHYSYRSRQEFVERNRRYTRMMVEYLRQQGRTTYFGEAVLHWLGNFVKSYVLRRGFLDGSAGLFLAWHIANASFMKYHLLRRVRRGQAPSTDCRPRRSTRKKPMS